MDYSLKEDLVEYFFDKAKSLIIPSEKSNYKSLFLQSNLLLGCVAFLLLLKITTTLVSINIPKNIFFADITKSVLENSVNQTRQALGLKSLTENQELDSAAQMKAQNMVQDQYFDHTSPTGVTPWYWFLKAGYNYKYAGENLAIGFFDSEEVYSAWLNSPSHKANIVNPNYTEVGTAVLSGFGPNNTIVVVQEFASPSPVKTLVAKAKTNVIPKAVAPASVSAVTTTPAPAVPTTATAATPQNKTQTAASNNAGEVLSQTTEMPSSLQSSNSSGVNNLSSRTINFIMYNYGALLQSVIYGISFIIIGILLTLIFFNFNLVFKRDLVARAALIMIILAAATLFNKEAIILMIPHQILI